MKGLTVGRFCVDAVVQDGFLGGKEIKRWGSGGDQFPFPSSKEDIFCYEMERKLEKEDHVAKLILL